MYPDVKKEYTESLIGGPFLKSMGIHEDFWNKFIVENKELINNIFSKLKKIRALDKKNITWRKSQEQIWEFELNPLLEEASYKVTDYGLNFEEFKK